MNPFVKPFGFKAMVISSLIASSVLALTLVASPAPAGASESASAASGTSSGTWTKHAAPSSRVLQFNGARSPFGVCAKRKRGGVACFPRVKKADKGHKTLEFIIKESQRPYRYRGAKPDQVLAPGNPGYQILGIGDEWLARGISCVLTPVEMNCSSGERHGLRMKLGSVASW